MVTFSPMDTGMTRTRGYIELHIAVLLWGFTAVLGKWISLPATDLVWWRVGLTALCLLPVMFSGRRLSRLTRRQVLIYAGIGCLVGLHWVCFYGSIKLANASVALVCMATTSMFAAVLEPMIRRVPFKRLDLGLSVLIVPAMLLVVGTLDASMYMGVAVGLASAGLAAIFSILNKVYVEDADAFTITFVEMVSAWIMVSVMLWVSQDVEAAWVGWPEGVRDWASMAVLVVGCTVLTFVLSLRALRVLSAFASVLVVNLEPVYGIVLAIVLLGEHRELSGGFYVGSVVIIAAVLSYPWLAGRLRN